MIPTDNRSQSYSFAGFWWRVLAYFLDTIVILIISSVVGLAIGLAVAGNGGGTDTAKVLGQIIGVIIGWVYFALFESSTARATLGKLACGLIVVSLDGDRISFGRATGRYFAKILSGLILGIGFFMAGWTNKKQALHDQVCDTVVLRRSVERGDVARVEMPMAQADTRLTPESGNPWAR